MTARPDAPTSPKTANGQALAAMPCCASFVRMFKPQFAPMVEAGTKRQTVRPTPKRMPKPGDKISLREWTDKPYRSKQRVLMESTISKVEAVGRSPELGAAAIQSLAALVGAAAEDLETRRGRDLEIGLLAEGEAKKSHE